MLLTSVTAVGLASALPLLAALIQVPLLRRKREALALKLESATEGDSLLMPQPGDGSAMRMILPASMLTLLYGTIWSYLVLAPSNGWALQSDWSAPLPAAAAGAYVWMVAVLGARASRNDLTEAVFWKALSGSVAGIVASLALPVFAIDTREALYAAALLTGVLVPYLLPQLLERIVSPVESDVPAENRLLLDAIFGIRAREKDRLNEEGIESVQHLATADILKLHARTPYPIATLSDWIDQAVALSRFSVAGIDALRKAGLPTGAVELSFLALDTRPSSGLIREKIAEALQKPPEIVVETLNALFHDEQVRKLARIAGRGDRSRLIGAGMGTTPPPSAA